MTNLLYVALSATALSMFLVGAVPGTPPTMESQVALANAPNWNTIIQSFLTAATALGTAWIGFQMSKVKVNSDVAMKTAGETAAGMKEVHTAVNSERAAMTAEVKKLNEQLAEMVKHNATLEEQKREDTWQRQPAKRRPARRR